jgi:hypothetical protein
MTSPQKSGLFIAVTAITLVAVFLAPPIAQPLSFHHFADSRALWGMPNFGNVVSNVPFVVIGIYGILMILGAPVPWSIRSIYLVLFAGVVLTGLGSAYYHWHPDNDTLVWDRIPMTIVFMSFLSATLAELVSRRLGVRVLLTLVAVGIGSVLWWYYTPAVKVILPSLVWIVVWYVIAKVFEQLDYQTYDFTGISGHSLKHLAAAVSTWYFVVLFRMKYLNAPKGRFI